MNLELAYSREIHCDLGHFSMLVEYLEQIYKVFDDILSIQKDNKRPLMTLGILELHVYRLGSHLSSLSRAWTSGLGSLCTLLPLFKLILHISSKAGA